LSTTVDVDDQEAPSDASRPAPASAAPIVVFIVAELVALVLWPVLARHRWFFLDDWDFLAARKAGDLGDLFRPHNEHWSTIPILVWRALFWAVGLRSYLPYQLVVVVLHLIAAALLLVVMRRAGVRPWIATAAAILFVFLGSGRTDIVSAFQMSFTGSLVFGLVQLLLSDHDGPIDRRDWLGLCAGLAGLMTSGVGVTMVVVVGIAVLMRRGWAPALFHTVPLGAAYMTWFFVIGHEGYESGQSSTHHIVQFVVTGLRSAYRAMGELPGVGMLLAIVLVVELVVACTDRARSPLRTRLAAPFALLIGSVVFLAIAAVGRESVRGVAPARIDRYRYVVAALTLPAVAVAADALASRYWVLVPVMIALFLVGVPGNIRALDRAERSTDTLNASYRTLIMSLAHDPVARQTPRSVRAESINAPRLTIGWLVDNARSGRVPSPGSVTPRDSALNEFRLSFLQQVQPRSEPPCQDALVLPTTVDLERGNVVGLYEGSKIFPTGSDAMDVRPANVNLVGPPMRFPPSDGTQLLVLRDVGPTRITAPSPYFPPRVCLVKR
jgi:hypothetical protein